MFQNSVCTDTCLPTGVFVIIPIPQPPDVIFENLQKMMVEKKWHRVGQKEKSEWDKLKTQARLLGRGGSCSAIQREQWSDDIHDPRLCCLLYWCNPSSISCLFLSTPGLLCSTWYTLWTVSLRGYSLWLSSEWPSEQLALVRRALAWSHVFLGLDSTKKLDLMIVYTL